MATETNQSLSCAQGDSFAFAIDMQPNPDGTSPDLTGATASWALCQSWFKGAALYLTKNSGAGITIEQANGVWQVIVVLDPADTANVPYGMLYHECKVTLADGSVSHVATGPFELTPSRIP